MNALAQKLEESRQIRIGRVADRSVVPWARMRS